MNYLDIMIISIVGLLILTVFMDNLYDNNICKHTDYAENMGYTEHNTIMGCDNPNDHDCPDSYNNRDINIFNNPSYDEYNEYQNQNLPQYLNDINIAHNNLFPWWNSTRHTRNMSYDIRGDPILQYYEIGPWLKSSLIF